jgi:BolA protein
MSTPANETLQARLLRALQEALEPTELVLIDDSAAHAGHAGAREGAHFQVVVVSARFNGLSRVARHRLVYDAVRPWMTSGVHALAIEARTPDEA